MGGGTGTVRRRRRPAGSCSHRWSLCLALCSLVTGLQLVVGRDLGSSHLAGQQHQLQANTARRGLQAVYKRAMQLGRIGGAAASTPLDAATGLQLSGQPRRERSIAGLLYTLQPQPAAYNEAVASCQAKGAALGGGIVEPDPDAIVSLCSAGDEQLAQGCWLVSPSAQPPESSSTCRMWQADAGLQEVLCSSSHYFVCVTADPADAVAAEEFEHYQDEYDLAHQAAAGTPAPVSTASTDAMPMAGSTSQASLASAAAGISSSSHAAALTPVPSSEDAPEVPEDAVLVGDTSYDADGYHFVLLPPAGYVEASMICSVQGMWLAGSKWHVEAAALEYLCADPAITPAGCWVEPQPGTPSGSCSYRMLDTLFAASDCDVPRRFVCARHREPGEGGGRQPPDAAVIATPSAAALRAAVARAVASIADTTVAEGMLQTLGAGSGSEGMAYAVHAASLAAGHPPRAPQLEAVPDLQDQVTPAAASSDDGSGKDLAKAFEVADLMYVMLPEKVTYVEALGQCDPLDMGVAGSEWLYDQLAMTALCTAEAGADAGCWRVLHEAFEGAPARCSYQQGSDDAQASDCGAKRAVLCVTHTTSYHPWDEDYDYVSPETPLPEAGTASSTTQQASTAASGGEQQPPAEEQQHQGEVLAVYDDRYYREDMDDELQYDRYQGLQQLPQAVDTPVSQAVDTQAQPGQAAAVAQQPAARMHAWEDKDWDYVSLMDEMDMYDYEREAFWAAQAQREAAAATPPAVPEGAAPTPARSESTTALPGAGYPYTYAYDDYYDEEMAMAAMGAATGVQPGADAATQAAQPAGAVTSGMAQQAGDGSSITADDEVAQEVADALARAQGNAPTDPYARTQGDAPADPYQARGGLALQHPGIHADDFKGMDSLAVEAALALAHAQQAGSSTPDAAKPATDGPAPGSHPAMAHAGPTPLAAAQPEDYLFAPARHFIQAGARAFAAFLDQHIALKPRTSVARLRRVLLGGEAPQPVQFQAQPARALAAADEPADTSTQELSSGEESSSLPMAQDTLPESSPPPQSVLQLPSPATQPVASPELPLDQPSPQPSPEPVPSPAQTTEALPQASPAGLPTDGVGAASTSTDASQTVTPNVESAVKPTASGSDGGSSKAPGWVPAITVVAGLMLVGMVGGGAYMLSKRPPRSYRPGHDHASYAEVELIEEPGSGVLEDGRPHRASSQRGSSARAVYARFPQV